MDFLIGTTLLLGGRTDGEISRLGSRVEETNSRTFTFRTLGEDVRKCFACHYRFWLMQTRAQLHVYRAFHTIGQREHAQAFIIPSASTLPRKWRARSSAQEPNSQLKCKPANPTMQCSTREEELSESVCCQTEEGLCYCRMSPGGLTPVPLRDGRGGIRN